MNTAPPLPAISAELLQHLRRLDASTLANAIETFHQRLRNEGFADGSIHCRFPDLPNLLGRAVTVKIRGSAPPTTAAPFPDRSDWLDYLLTVPAPRVVVIQDVATRIGFGSLLGAVHMNILRALDCVGAITNGSARDLPAARALGFQLFTGGISVSHAYVHVLEFGSPVLIGGLTVHSGDLLHGDQHGVQNIPLAIAPEIPAAARRLQTQENELIALCQAPGFSLAKLRTALDAPTR